MDNLYFQDIGDYLTKEQKLEIISGYGSIAGIAAEEGWQAIAPDEHGDWLKQRDNRFSSFFALGEKGSDKSCMFEVFSNGVKSNRDVWVFNSSRTRLGQNIQGMIDFFNEEAKRYEAALPEDKKQEVNKFIRMTELRSVGRMTSKYT